MADYTKLTLDELVAEKLRLKHDLESVRAELHTVAGFYKDAVAGFHLDEAYAQLAKAAERDGRSLIDQAKFWLLDENADDPGHRIQAGAYLKNEGVL